MKKTLLKLIGVLILAALLITAGTGCGKQVLPADSSNNVTVMTDKEKMLEAFALVNKAILNINQIKQGTLTSEYAEPLMPDFGVVKDETTFKKTLKGISFKTRETYANGETKLFKAAADETVSKLANVQWYPNESIKKSYFDNAEKLTITKKKEGTEFLVNWKPVEINTIDNIYMKYNYSAITVDKNGYLTVWIINASKYAKDEKGNITSVTQGAVTVRLSNYRE